MGNSTSSPDKLALQTFSSFIDELKSENLEGLTQDIESNTDHLLGIYIEDFLVTSKELADLTIGDQVKCVGVILFLRSALFSRTKDVPFSKREKVLRCMTIDGFVSNTHPSKVLTKYLSSVVRYDGTNFYKWEGNTWVQREECNVLLEDLSVDFACDKPITPNGIDHPMCTAASKVVNEYLGQLKDAIFAFNTGPARCDFLKSMKKEEASSFNMKYSAIPCYSSVFLTNKAKSRAYKPKDEFTVRLPFDISQNTSAINDEYFSTLCGPSSNTDASSIANFIVSCGCRLSDSITIITGAPKSGKKTLLNLVQSLYGPYACGEADHNNGDVNYDFVRTCFYDNDDILSDEFLLQKHPCGHIVLVSNTTDPTKIPKTFSGRSVRTITLSSTIPPLNQDKSIIDRLSTRKQLARFLGWAAENYNALKFSTECGDLCRKLVLLMASELARSDSESDSD